jgi:hypothetical protein
VVEVVVVVAKHFRIPLLVCSTSCVCQSKLRLCTKVDKGLKGLGPETLFLKSLLQSETCSDWLGQLGQFNLARLG